MNAEPTNLRLPIGVSNFKKLVTGGNTSEAYTFIDKTRLIHDFILDGSEVVLWTRPRRFGKTLNLSMLYYFFSCTESTEQDLFQGLKIKEAADLCQRYQGQYPTIFMSFKEIKKPTFDKAYSAIEEIIRILFQNHKILLEQGNMDTNDREIFSSILAGNAKDIHIETSLQLLSRYLYAYYGKKVIMLIDEYDTPIHAAHQNSYYQDMIDLMRALFGSGLKDNDFIHKAAVTGILRVAKEDIFSGVNNLVVDSFLDREYADYFGFSETDVKTLFQLANMPADLSAIQTWYNGYQVEEVTLYNPWSILHCLKRKGKLAAYWVNTSDNYLIKKLITGANQAIQEDIKRLMQGEFVEEILNPFLNLKHMKKNRTSILTLLCMSGYLNATPVIDAGGRTRHHLRIPNQEVRYLYEEIISQWLSANNGVIWLEACLEDLKAARMSSFTDKLRQIAINIFSYHDTKGRLPEAFFHGFMLGLTLYCQADYTIKSNREAGTGRFDIAMIPKDSNSELPGILFEIKSIPDADMQTLEASAD
jgi:hypothetical protein